MKKSDEMIQEMTVRLTFIGPVEHKPMDEDILKKLLRADDCHVTENKIFIREIEND